MANHNVQNSFPDHRRFDPARYTLAELCNFVVAMTHAYDDVAGQIEDRAYAECEQGNLDYAVGRLAHLCRFLEQLPDKNEEVCRDLADVYLLIGEIYLCAGRYNESEQWFEKAVVVDDSYDVPYHSLASAHIHQGRDDAAVRCLEQEILVAPGNYYTYLQLADLYEKLGRKGDVRAVLESLLERDPGNIRALHRLVTYHERMNPGLDVELLRRQIINADHGLAKLELVIWTYHMCREKRYRDAMLFLDRREQDSDGLSITHLLKAHIYGKLRLYRRKREELGAFAKLCHGIEKQMRTKLDEFASVFGSREAEQLAHRLAVARPASA